METLISLLKRVEAMAKSLREEAEQRLKAAAATTPEKPTAAVCDDE
jgi:hypothetical protein